MHLANGMRLRDGALIAAWGARIEEGGVGWRCGAIEVCSGWEEGLIFCHAFGCTCGVFS